MCSHNRRVVWANDGAAADNDDDEADDDGDGDNGDGFDTGHVSQSSCHSKMEQELTDTDTEKENLLDSDNGENSNESTYLTIQNVAKWLTTKWNNLV